jgi:hypothetical protein
MGVDAGACISPGECVPEERGARGFFQALPSASLNPKNQTTDLLLGDADKVALRTGLRDGGLGEGEDEDVFRQDTLFLDACG